MTVARHGLLDPPRVQSPAAVARVRSPPCPSCRVIEIRRNRRPARYRAGHATALAAWRVRRRAVVLLVAVNRRSPEPRSAGAARLPESDDMSSSFALLGVPPSVCDALGRRGVTSPFEIQAATIADALAGRDVCARAPTGSGKTLAFGIPLVVMTTKARPQRPTSLVLAPTRELAEQIAVELRSFADGVSVDAVYGGVGYGHQLRALRSGVDVLVACPGRLEDLVRRGDVHLGDVRNVVLDEADRMADMGFLPVVRRLLDLTAGDRQTLLFSATLDGDVAKLTAEYQSDPVRHEVGDATPDVRSAVHRFWKVERTERNQVVADVVCASWPSIVFCRTRHGADRLAKQLGRLGVVAAPIHGGRSQGQRTRALADFADGRLHALIATDVAARGIHVDGVASVIHYDPPEDHKAYVHRSGRTARAGRDGVVVSLVQPDQTKVHRNVQRAVGLDEPLTEPTVADLPVSALAGDRLLAPAREQGRPSDDRPRRSERRSNASAGKGRREGRGDRSSREMVTDGRTGRGGAHRDGRGSGAPSSRRGERPRSGDDRTRGADGAGTRSRGGADHSRRAPTPSRANR
jgi:superfamily II DNA/RNA helicase